MPSNIEIKASVKDMGKLRALTRQIAVEPCQVLLQEDIFFNSGKGRLKLRIFGDESGQLIYYQRPDTCESKQSDYEICPIPDPRALRRVLSASLGEIITVRKRRELYISGQTRIHLDEVDGLGSFMELEVVLKPGQPPQDGQKIAAEIMAKLCIRETDLVSRAYADLLMDDANK